MTTVKKKNPRASRESDMEKLIRIEKNNFTNSVSGDAVTDIQELTKEVQRLKELQAESEAVEKYMMSVLTKGGGYDDLLKAHYRQGAVVDGKWVDEEDEDSLKCSFCGGKDQVGYSGCDNYSHIVICEHCDVDGDSYTGWDKCCSGSRSSSRPC